MLISFLTPRDTHATKWPTLWAVGMTHVLDVPLYEQGHKKCSEPVSAVKRVFEHVFFEPHPHIRQKQDQTSLWTIFSLGARRVILFSDVT